MALHDEPGPEQNLPLLFIHQNEIQVNGKRGTTNMARSNKMTPRQRKLYGEVLAAGPGFLVQCNPQEWRIAQALVKQGCIELVGNRSSSGFFEVRAIESSIPDDLRERYRAGTLGMGMGK